jgi:DNA repair protein SbcD/Mre11
LGEEKQLLKILHTGDLHIGMKFNQYPEQVRERLVKARLDTLTDLVALANQEGCDLLVVAGDLFENTRISKSLVAETIFKLNQFEGHCVLILPGNHDYNDGVNDLWSKVRAELTEKIILLEQNQPYDLQPYDMQVNVFAAGCDQRHSEENRISWIKHGGIDNGMINIGIAHGALEGISADLQGQYFPMNSRELTQTGLDLWLLGHCHIRYPDQDLVTGASIFNCGTPEPDGMNFMRSGNAWLIELDDDKCITARSTAVGRYRFYDLEWEINNEEDIDRLNQNLLTGEAGTKLVRLRLYGSLEDEIYGLRQELYDQWEEQLFYFKVDDSELRQRVSRETIDQEFTQGSFPHRLLHKLADDPEALQMAYELIRQVR